MEKDDTLKNVELLPELLTQTETEGKLYTLIPAYGILTPPATRTLSERMLLLR